MKYEIYNPKNTYITDDGNYITPELFALEHNSVNERLIAVGLEGRTIVEVKDYDYLRSKYSISSDVSDEQALKIINEAVKLASEESTPLERIAASLEYIVLHLISGGGIDELL
jgi:uncharacterized protein involved in propanediol utilization